MTVQFFYQLQFNALMVHTTPDAAKLCL